MQRLNLRSVVSRSPRTRLSLPIALSSLNPGRWLSSNADDTPRESDFERLRSGAHVPTLEGPCVRAMQGVHKAYEPRGAVDDGKRLRRHPTFARARLRLPNHMVIRDLKLWSPGLGRKSGT